jgi:hypothetical protein
MFWINPYSQRNQRHRWLNQQPPQLAKPQVLKARPYVARPSIYTIDADDWKRMQEGLRLLRWQVKDLRAHLAQRRLGLKYNPDVDEQPRDDRGRWVDAGGGDKGPADDGLRDPGLITRPAFLAPGLPVAQQALMRALAIFGLMSAGNAPDSTTVLEINARSFSSDGTPEGPWGKVDVLTREEADELCPKRPLVQKFLDEAAVRHRPESYRNASTRGTAIHLDVARQINNLNDPDFRAEVSVYESQEERYGKKGTKRLDVFENTRKDATVCIHDEKTGKAPLSFADMKRLVAEAHSLYPGTQRVIVTDVRPSR